MVTIDARTSTEIQGERRWSLPQVLGLGRGLGGTEMAAKEMESALERAKQVMSAKYVGVHRYQWSSRLVDWAGFGLTSAITLIAGALGRALRTGEDPASAVREALEAQTATSTRRWANIVGAIAATVSIMIGLSGRLQSESQRQLGQAENLRQLITSARKYYLSAPGPEEALAVATNLDAETRKNE
ncbi:MAG: hypothetical protein JO344_13920 [Planctomycetaceae bacterium]|nr:hypothetical protein [Planctomycetaceae bacterium]